MEELARDVAVYNEFHALLVFLGKHWCKKVPRCGGCPLEGLWGDHDIKPLSIAG
jgi:endonuclease-3 related protein